MYRYTEFIDQKTSCSIIIAMKLLKYLKPLYNYYPVITTYKRRSSDWESNTNYYYY